MFAIVGALAAAGAGVERLGVLGCPRNLTIAQPIELMHLLLGDESLGACCLGDRASVSAHLRTKAAVVELLADLGLAVLVVLLGMHRQGS